MVVTTTTNSTQGLVDSCWLKSGALLNGRNQLLRFAYIRVARTTIPLTKQTRIMIATSVLGAIVVILCLTVFASRWFLSSHRMVKRRLQEKWIEAKGSMVKFTYR